MQINKAEWLKRYKQALVDIAGMGKICALKYLMSNDGEFDMGYSPEWYVREDIACNYNNIVIFMVIEKFDGKEV